MLEELLQLSTFGLLGKAKRVGVPADALAAVTEVPGSDAWKTALIALVATVLAPQLAAAKPTPGEEALTARAGRGFMMSGEEAFSSHTRDLERGSIAEKDVDELLSVRSGAIELSFTASLQQ
jgi:hypothetical protein